MKCLKIYFLKPVVFILVFILIAFVINHYKSENRKEKLKNTKQTLGIFQGQVVGIGFTGFNYSYQDENGKSHTFVEKREFKDLKIGDSVLIEYSLNDYEIGSVILPYYRR